MVYRTVLIPILLLIHGVCWGQGLFSDYEVGCDECPSPVCCIPDLCCQRNWMTFGFEEYWLDGFDTPALLTQSPAGTPRASAGVLTDPNTSTGVDGNELGDDSVSGFRIGFGSWLDHSRSMAVVGSLRVASGTTSQAYPSDASTIIARPFFNADPAVNAADSELVNFPGVLSGSATISTGSDVFSGGIGFQNKVFCCQDSRGRSRRLDTYLGYRAFSLEEQLTIYERLEPVGGLVVPGTLIEVVDAFETENHFHGVEVAILSSIQRNRWAFDFSTRVALGNIHQRAHIRGSTTITVPGVAPTVQPFGLLAVESNSGTFDRNRFGVLTDTQLRAGYWLSCRTKLYFGYSLMFLNSMVRPGSLVNTTVNATQIDPLVPTTGPAVPTFAWRDESLFLHGLSVGAEFRF